MELNTRIKAFVTLGNQMKAALERAEGAYEGLSKAQINFLLSIKKAGIANGWFSEGSVRLALNAIVEMLDENALVDWVGNYYKAFQEAKGGKKVGVIMAGNIPAVGFHDFLSVLISGNNVVVKLSSDDKELIPAISSLLIEGETAFEPYINILNEPFKEFDAVIATGSDNSSRYFEHYFGKYPNIIRKSRTSLAVLNGNESEQEILDFSKDLFRYYGLGCRNVSKVLLPRGYDVPSLIKALEEPSKVLDNSKYINNLDYNKSILLVNREPFLDGGFFLLKESKDLFSPLSVLYYDFYDSEEEVEGFINEHKQDIQCVVDQAGEYDGVKFGEAQTPRLDDYADKVDSLEFCLSL